MNKRISLKYQLQHFIVDNALNHQGLKMRTRSSSCLLSSLFNLLAEMSLDSSIVFSRKGVCLQMSL